MRKEGWYIITWNGKRDLAYLDEYGDWGIPRSDFGADESWFDEVGPRVTFKDSGDNDINKCEVVKAYA